MKKVVLLADDDRDDAEIFHEALEQVESSTQFFRVEDGSEVFAFLNNEDNPLPDVIFLDLNMPIMNGWQCLSMLRNKKEFGSIPVIIYTTSSNPRDLELAKDLKADGLITKPSDPNVLTRILTLIIQSVGSERFDEALREAYFLSKALRA
jgi:CheY-like chemotaxis protein